MVSIKDINRKFQNKYPNKGICPECGSKNPRNALFCQECGKKFLTISEADRKKGTKNILLIVGAVLLCCIGAIFLYTMIFPVTALDVDKDTNVVIDNQTINYALKGKTEANSTVKFNSEALKLNNTEIKADDNGNFEYQITIPLEVKKLNVEVLAKSPKKSQHRGSWIITRISKENQSTQSLNSAPEKLETQYQIITVGGLKCEIDSSLAGGTNDFMTGKYFYESPDSSFLIEVYTSNSKYQEAVDYATGPNVKVSSETVSGHNILCYRDKIHSGDITTYFFTVNGKNVGVLDDGNSVDKHLVESFYNLN